MDQISIHDIIGIVGVAIVLVTYLLLQIERMSSSSLLYSLANLIGAVLIMVSLVETWNLASVIIEIAWGLISLYGIYRYYTIKKR
jgi:hypothetical protein